MNLKKFYNQLFYLLKQNQKDIVIPMFISFLLCFYFIFAVIPYGDMQGFSSAECNLKIKEQVVYLILTIPFIIWYIITIFSTIKNLKFMRIIIYPIILLTLFLCVFMSVSVFGYVYSMLCLFVFWYLFPICLIITEIYAIVQDIKTFKNTTLPKE